MRALKQAYAIVDFDPRVIQRLSELGEPHVYGDVGDELFLEQIEAHKTKMIISTIPDVTVSITLVMYSKSKKYSGVVVVSVHTPEEATVCYEMGADYVIIPNYLSGKKFAEILKGNRTRKRAWEVDRKPFLA